MNSKLIVFLTLFILSIVSSRNEWQTYPLDSPNYKNYFETDCRGCGLVNGGTHCIDNEFRTTWCCNYKDLSS